MSYVEMSEAEKELWGKIAALKAVQGLFTVGSISEINEYLGEETQKRVRDIAMKVSRDWTAEQKAVENSKKWYVVVSGANSAKRLYLGTGGEKTDQGRAKLFKNLIEASEESKKFRFGRLVEV
jgi:hypothetical protein